MMSFFRICIILGLIILGSTPVLAQVSWDGGGDGFSWSNPSNWSNDMTPEISDTVIIDMDAHVIADSTIHFAGAIRIGDGDTLTQLGAFRIAGRLKIDSGGVFEWRDFNWDWPKIDNYGKINVFVENSDIVDSGMLITNFDIGKIVIVENPGIAIKNGSLINYGQILILSPDFGTILAILPDSASLINHAGGIIRKVSFDPSFKIDIPLTNYGSIICDSGLLQIDNLKKFMNGSYLETATTGEILFQGELLSFHGQMNGVANGLMKIDCDFESVDGSIDFTGDGFTWIRESFVNGDTLFNYGNLTIKGNLNSFLKDSSVLRNQGMILFENGAGLNFTDGEIINDSVFLMGNFSSMFISGGAHQLFTNMPGGLINKSQGENSTIGIDLVNYGTIQCEVNKITMNGPSAILHDGSVLNTNDTSTIEFNPTLLSINGLISGNASGSIVMKGDWSSNNGSANFQEEGFSWDAGSYVKGGTFTNNGLLSLGNGFKFIEDSSTIHNKGIIDTRVNGNLWFEDGRLINDSIFNFNGGVDILLSGGNLHQFINNASAVFRSLGGTVNSDFDNYGTILSVGGVLSINGEKICRDGSQIHTTDSSSVSLLSGNLLIEGRLSGNGIGETRLNCDFRSTDGTIDFDGMGLLWNTSSFIGGDTLINQGKLTINGSSPAIEDSSVLINSGHMDIPTSKKLEIQDGILINDSLMTLAGSGGRINWTLGSQHVLVNRLTGIIERSGTGTSFIKPDLVNYGTLRALEGILFIQGVFENEASGQMEGVATIELPSAYINHGYTSPGLSPGKLTIDNKLIQDSLGSMKIEINGATAVSDYDQISAFFADLSGTIDVALGYQPAMDATFDVLLAGNQFSLDCNLPDTVFSQFNGSQHSFLVDCSTNVVRLTYGGIASVDTSGPELVLMDVTVTLDSSTGEGILTGGLVDGGSMDPSGIDTFLFDPPILDCSSDDTVCVVVTVIDGVGNQSQDTVKVFVFKPQLEAVWVNQNASGNGFGLNAENGINDLTSAFSVTNGCVTTVKKIYLVEGLYKPNDQGVANRNSSFRIPDTMHIIGGYSSDGSQNDPTIYQSVLSGDIGIADDSTDNAYHVVTIPSTTDTILIEGIIIEKGHADMPGHMQGGGLLVNGRCYLGTSQIRHNQADTAGSAIYIAVSGHLVLISGNKTEMNSGPVIIQNEIGSFFHILDSNELKD